MRTSAGGGGGVGLMRTKAHKRGGSKKNCFFLMSFMDDPLARFDDGDLGSGGGDDRRVGVTAAVEELGSRHDDVHLLLS